MLNKENRKVLKDEIENLLNNYNSEEFSDSIVDDQIAKETEVTSQYDFDEMSKQFTDKAKDITDSLLEYYVELGILEKNNYVKNKKELDTLNISNMFFQIKTLKITITKIMEEITTGNTHPRLIEVFGQLQDKLRSVTQTQANYMLFLEETYKKINSEGPANDNTNLKIESNPNEGEFFITVGTKNMVDALPETEQNEVDKELIDPANKSTLIKDTNITIEKDEEGPDIIDVTEII
jgi:hypothetical protein